MSNIDTAIRHLLNGVIISAKTPKIELDSETKTIALTVYKDSYICVGFDKYFIEEDSTSFITYTDNCIVTLTYNSYTKLFSGVLDDSIPDDTMAIGYLIIANGKLENSSWVSNCSCEPSKLSISAPSSIVISNTNNKIVFPGDMTILFNNKSYPITRHPDIDLKNINGIISLYYNPSTHRFTINNLNEENSILIATYDKTNDILSYNPYPTLICVEAKTTTPDYDVALWGYNYDKTTHSIEWDKFYCVNKTTGEVHSVPEGSFELDKKEVGYFMIIFNQNIFEVSVINNPNFLPENCVILDTFTYTLVDGFKTKSNTDNKLMPLEGRINKLAAIVDENILNPNTKLLLTDKLYIVNNNPILKTSMTIAGLTTNTITIIDSNGNISYPSLGATFNEGLNTIYSGNDSKTVEVFKYTSEEVNKDYKFGIIAHEDVYRDNLSLPGSIVFAKQITESYEALVGIDTTKGHSPFMRIAGSLDKEKYPAWCYRKTGAKNELSYALSSDKSGDFYIFDIRYYLLSIGINDSDPLTHLIINADYNKISTAVEAVKIMYTIIHDTYPNLNIGLAPMVSHGPRNSNTQIEANRQDCIFVEKVIALIDSIDTSYNTTVLPLWLYINPMVSNDIAKITEVWNCISGWAYNTTL